MKREEVNLSAEQNILADIFEKHFAICYEVTDNIISAELSGYTNGGVNECVSLNPFTFNEFKEYVEDYDIDSTIDLYRESADYRNAFSIKESVEDFEAWLESLKELVKEIDSKIEDSKDVCYEVCPHCDNEVVLDFEFKVQTCPVCGKRIVPCNLCRRDEIDNYDCHYSCENCILCGMADLENKELEEK